jgi:hypothetical protein
VRKGHEYEFGGPIGTAVNTVALPLVILFLYYACPNEGTFCLSGVDVASLVEMPVPSWAELLSLEAVGVFCAWFLGLVVLERALPYQEGQGVQLKTGGKLSYRLNGHLTFWLALFIVEHTCPLTYLYDNYIQLAVAAIVFSTAMSVFLYAASFRKGALLADGGNTGNVPYDFWMGRELNPRIGSFDLKVFCELRPGLIGWAVLNLGNSQRSAPLHFLPELPESQSLSRACSCVFFFVYVVCVFVRM